MRRPALALFVLFQALYLLTASGWVFRIPDEYEVYLQTESLVDRQSLAIPQVQELGRGDAFFGKRATGELYAPYGPLAAGLALPHHLAGRVVASGIERGERWRLLVSAITSLATGTAGALAVAGFFRAARALGASERRASALAIVLGLGTVLWPYATSFFSEAFAAAAFVWASAFLLEARARGSPWRVGAAALLLAVAVLTKATNLVYAVPLALTPLASTSSERRGVAAALLAAVVASALVHMQWNTHRFGSPFDFGYDWGETVHGTPRAFGGDLFRGLTILLVSPGKSLFVWAPALLLAAARVRSLDRSVATGLTLTLAAGLLVFGSYMFVEGGYCHGPRHLVPIVPLLLLPAASGRAPSRPALALALVLGTTWNGLAVATSYLEDQAWGEDRSRAVYYERDPDPRPGLPSNRYRLGYTPELTLPALVLSSLGKMSRGERETPGTGINLLGPNLERAGVRPGWLAGLELAGLVTVVLASLGLRSTLLRKKNAAILRP